MQSHQFHDIVGEDDLTENSEERVNNDDDSDDDESNGDYSYALSEFPSKNAQPGGHDREYEPSESEISKATVLYSAFNNLCFSYCGCASFNWF